MRLPWVRARRGTASARRPTSVVRIGGTAVVGMARAGEGGRAVARPDTVLHRRRPPPLRPPPGPPPPSPPATARAAPAPPPRSRGRARPCKLQSVVGVLATILAIQSLLEWPS